MHPCRAAGVWVWLVWVMRAGNMGGCMCSAVDKAKGRQLGCGMIQPVHVYKQRAGHCFGRIWRRRRRRVRLVVVVEIERGLVIGRLGQVAGFRRRSTWRCSLCGRCHVVKQRDLVLLASTLTTAPTAVVQTDRCRLVSLGCSSLVLLRLRCGCGCSRYCCRCWASQAN